ncbi:MAG: hypothetical protein MR531_07655 [Lachnospiraceae bacterium]|nr:hypothetical protein [Lachnospiraceae bacterium]
MKKGLHNMKTIFAMAGILLWIGAVSPEIFVEGGMGCIKDVNGEELTRQEAQALLEELLYGDLPEQEMTIVYKSKILEWIQGSLE